MKSLRKKGMAVVLSTLLIMNYSLPVLAADDAAAASTTATTTTTAAAAVKASDSTTASAKTVKASDSTTTSAKTYAITTSATHGTITGNVNVESGKDQTINYHADEGYALAMLLVDGVRMSVKEYPRSYTFKNVTSAHTIKAIYLPEGEIGLTLPTYTIESKVTNGTIDKTTEVDVGGNITIHYAPHDGYVLSKLIIDGESVDESEFRNYYTFTAVSENHSIEVEFTQEDNSKNSDTHTVRTSVENGTITETDSAVADGANKTIKYAPNSGYTLKEVLVDGVKVDLESYPSSYTFTNVTKDHSIVVTYGSSSSNNGGTTNNNNNNSNKTTYTITTTATNGTITESKTVNAGDKVTISYSPNSGYQLSRVTVDGETVDTSKYGGSYTFDNVNANHSIRVVYRKASSSTTSSSSSTSSSASSARTRSSSSATSTGSDAATGDGNNVEGYALLAAAAGLTCGGLLLTRRKKQ